MKKHYYTNQIIEICNGKHCTVEGIFNTIISKNPEAGKSSIYRNVEELVEKGVLVKVVGIGKKAYFEKNKGNHIHLIDKNTGKIIDLDIKKEISIPNLPENFNISNMDIKIFGEFDN